MEYALITGASGGIGLELAKIFALNNVNLVLVARSEDKLNELADVFIAEGVKVIIYAKDLSRIENVKFIYNDLKSKNIEVNYLVNNAGFGTHGNFIDIPWEREYEMINLNIIALTYFTKKFSGNMKVRGEGKILNIASTAACQPGPKMAAYSASKAFVLSLSEAINHELKGTGVTVTTLCPGVTVTDFFKVAGVEGIKLGLVNKASARDVAEYGYKIMMKGKRTGIHGFMNRFFAFSGKFSPKSAVLAITSRLMSGHKS